MSSATPSPCAPPKVCLTDLADSEGQPDRCSCPFVVVDPPGRGVSSSGHGTVIRVRRHGPEGRDVTRLGIIGPHRLGGQYAHGSTPEVHAGAVKHQHSLSPHRSQSAAPGAESYTPQDRRRIYARDTPACSGRTWAPTTSATWVAARSASASPRRWDICVTFRLTEILMVAAFDEWRRTSVTGERLGVARERLRRLWVGFRCAKSPEVVPWTLARTRWPRGGRRRRAGHVRGRTRWRRTGGGCSRRRCR